MSDNHNKKTSKTGKTIVALQLAEKAVEIAMILLASGGKK